MMNHHQQRRIFRGRGGATDRRLPKHNARRRKPLPSGPSNERQNKYGETSAPIPRNLHESTHSEETIDDDRLELVEESPEKVDSQTALNSSPDESPAYLSEIHHLKRRVRNVQEVSIQLSRDAIASDLTKYRDNVLNATQNCVNEWRSIARHYNDNPNLPSAMRIEVGLAVFQLIQLSIQCGPLSGAKPGYFKRCGSEVAKIVLDFLEEVVPNHETLGITLMGFSSKQLDTMNTWKANAQKAVLNDKPPSKSVLKKLQKQQESSSKKTKKKPKKKQ